MQLDFDADEITVAARAVLAGGPGRSPLVGELVADPFAIGIAIEFATRIVAPTEVHERVTDGATAFMLGLQVSVCLGPVDHRLLDQLADAIEAVREAGRHTVIARHCDLAAIADVERIVAATLGGGDPQAPFHQSVLQLFELGLAVGLAAKTTGPGATPDSG